MVKNRGISIIIVHYNAVRHLERCLVSISTHLAVGNIETIVVDNSSPDRAIEQFPCLFPHVTFFLRNTNDGFGAGCNFGAQRARFSHLLFMNPDVELIDHSPLLLSEELERRRELGAVGGLMLDSSDSPRYCYNRFPDMLWEFYHLIGFGYNAEIKRLLRRPKLLRGEPFEVDWLHGAFLMVRADDFAAVGGFDERYFMYGEDTDICFRLRRQLHKINLCIPSVRYRHATHSSIENEKNDNIYSFHIQRGKLLFFRHYGWPRRWVLHLMGTLNFLLRIVILPVWGKYRGKRTEKFLQILKILRLYFDKSFVYSSKYVYIKH